MKKTGRDLIHRNHSSYIYLSLLVIINLLQSCIVNKPPKEKGIFKTPDLVELIKEDSTIKLDIRYATTNNFTGIAVYPVAKAYLQRPAAEALRKINNELKPLGVGLLIFDGYRPWRITKKFWDVTPKKDKKFVADPRKGSRHNRGCAVDLSLYNLATGKEITMPGEYDETSERSYPSYAGGTEAQRKMRDLLRSKMEANGFTVFEYEWWHFDYNDWRSYPILDIAFSEIQ